MLQLRYHSKKSRKRRRSSSRAVRAQKRRKCVMPVLSNAVRKIVENLLKHTKSVWERWDSIFELKKDWLKIFSDQGSRFLNLDTTDAIGVINTSCKRTFVYIHTCKGVKNRVEMTWQNTVYCKSRRLQCFIATNLLEYMLD